MSRFSGPQGRGAKGRMELRKRFEAEERQRQEQEWMRKHEAQLRAEYEEQRNLRDIRVAREIQSLIRAADWSKERA